MPCQPVFSCRVHLSILAVEAVTDRSREIRVLGRSRDADADDGVLGRVRAVDSGASHHFLCADTSNHPDGAVLAACEKVAVEDGRALVRKTLTVAGKRKGREFFPLPIRE